MTPEYLRYEGKNIKYDDRKEWHQFWLVDPLDGTKDFIKKNDEFSVNIALIEDHSPIFGVVYAPATKLLYWGGETCGTWKQESNSPAQEINVNTDVSVATIENIATGQGKFLPPRK